MKSVGMTEPKQMATFTALGGIATDLRFEKKSFSSWMELEDAFKKTWCTKLNLTEAISRACQSHQKEDGYIREYIVMFEKLKIFLRNDCSNTHQHFYAEYLLCCTQLVQRVKAARADMKTVPDGSDCHCL